MLLVFFIHLGPFLNIWILINLTESSFFIQKNFPSTLQRVMDIIRRMKRRAVSYWNELCPDILLDILRKPLDVISANIACFWFYIRRDTSSIGGRSGSHSCLFWSRDEGIYIQVTPVKATLSNSLEHEKFPDSKRPRLLKSYHSYHVGSWQLCGGK